MLRSITLALLICATPLAAARAQDGTLLVGNKGEDTISFIDLASGKEVARRPTGRMPHEVAVSPDGRQAAIVNYGGTTIDVFEIATQAKLRTIELAPNKRPHGLLWLRDGRLVATAEGSRSIVVVKPDGSVLTIPTDADRSHMVAVSPDQRTAYVANIGSGSVSVIDLRKGRKLRDIATGGEPEGLAVAEDGKVLWVGDLKAPRVQAFATATGRRLAEVAVDPVAIRVVASPDGRAVATSNLRAGTISLIDSASRKLVRTVPVSSDEKAGQVTILFSADGRRLYAAETGHDRVAEIDLATGKVLRRLEVGDAGDGLAIAGARATRR